MPQSNFYGPSEEDMRIKRSQSFDEVRSELGVLEYSGQQELDDFPRTLHKVWFCTFSSLVDRCLTRLLVEMKPRCLQVARTGHFTGNLEPYQEIFITHRLALTDSEVHQQEPSAFQRHSVRLVDAEAKTIDILAHLSTKEEGSISPLTQIDDETSDI